MQFDAGTSAHFKGRVMWAVINDDGSMAHHGTLEPVAPSNNLILDQGLDLIGSNHIVSCFKNCAVGTGTSTPAVTQIELDNEHARTNNWHGPLCGTTIPADGSSPFTFTFKRGWDFPEGSLDSSVDGNYTELGFSHSATAGQNLFSRTLIKDEGGNTISVSVASDQILRIAYELDVTVGPSSPTAGSVTITNIGTLNYTAQLEYLQDHIRTVDADGNNASYVSSMTNMLLEPAVAFSDGNTDIGVGASTAGSVPFVGPSWADEYWTDGSWAGGGGTETMTNPSTGVYRHSIVLGTGEMVATGIKHIMPCVFASNGYQYRPMRFEMDAGSEFDKADTHELTLNFELTFTAN